METPDQLTSADGGKRRRTVKVQKYGSRAKVMHGGAEKTTGGLTKEDLMYNGKGRIVSKKRHHTMKERIKLK